MVLLCFGERLSRQPVKALLVELEDVRQVLISVNKIGKRAAKIEELDFSKDDTAVEVATPRIVKAGNPDLFPAPSRKLQAGE